MLRYHGINGSAIEDVPNRHELMWNGIGNAYWMASAHGPSVRKQLHDCCPTDVQRWVEMLTDRVTLEGGCAPVSTIHAQLADSDQAWRARSNLWLEQLVVDFAEPAVQLVREAPHGSNLIVTMEFLQREAPHYAARTPLAMRRRILGVWVLGALSFARRHSIS